MTKSSGAILDARRAGPKGRGAGKAPSNRRAPAQQDAQSFSFPARVYWEDTDGGGVVYYANYLRFLERARTEWLRAAGISQQALAREQGIVFTVTSLEVHYRRPARLDDELLVTCSPQRAGAASLSFAQRILRRSPGTADAVGDALLTEAAVRVACVDARTFRPQRLPQFLLDVLHQ